MVFPGTLLELWRVLNACVNADKIILMQAANTGLTEGSTPNGNDYDRDIVIISTLRLDKLHLLDKGGHWFILHRSIGGRRDLQQLRRLAGPARPGVHRNVAVRAN